MAQVSALKSGSIRDQVSAGEWETRVHLAACYRLMARYGMQVIDWGVGLLSMHAPMELAGKLDIYMAYKGYLAFMKDGRGK